MTLFRDRQDAGRQLAAALDERLAARQQAALDLVLALPRGGVPVAAEVAERLGVPLDVVLVRKLGAPGHEELALGAIAAVARPQRVGELEDDAITTVLNEEILAALGVADEEIERVKEAQVRELERRERAYRAGRVPLRVEGLSVAVVDDGVATGATILAAAKALREAGTAWLTLAVPVAPREAIAQLEAAADEVVCLHALARLQSVGQWYRDFSQTSDEEVTALLARHGGPAG